MSQWKVILATLIIFGSGVITGGLLVKTTTQPLKAVRHKDGNPNAPAPWQLQRADFRRRMEKDLDLTTEQKQHIDKIFHDSQERMKPVWDQISPQLHGEIERVQTDIRSELTPEQRQKFDELLKAHPKKGEKTDDKRHKKKDGMTNVVPATNISSTNQ